jgi:23S rRNA pseudouridine1911/1915/1917 synthase
MTIQSKASVTHKAKAGAESAGQRLDRFLAGALPDLSRMRLKTLIQSGQVSLNGETITEPSYRVKPGESFTVTVPPAVDATPQAQDIALQIVYEDDALIVVDKPAGLVVHPAPGNPDRTLVNALLAHCGDSLSGIGGVRRPGIVHRLDKDTSGLMVVAKTDAAHAALAAQLADRSLKRTYHAVVWGAPSPRSGTVDRPIGRDPRNRKRMAVVSRGGKEARTHYKVLEAFGPAAEPIAALVECRLETGRTHQIRVHMAALGHPLIGDPLYGRARRGRTSRLDPETRDAVAGFDRQALHATALSFRHPTSGKMLNFQAPPPPDMKALLGTLR